MCWNCFFEAFIAYVNEKNVMKKNIQYSIQTNGTLIDEKWIQLLKENDFLVGVSVDGFVKNHDWFRKDVQGKGTHKKILYTLRMLKNAGIAYNILTVLTKQLSKNRKNYINSIQNLGILMYRLFHVYLH